MERIPLLQVLKDDETPFQPCITVLDSYGLVELQYNQTRLTVISAQVG